jgi:hypothetical protein
VKIRLSGGLRYEKRLGQQILKRFWRSIAFTSLLERP